MPANEVKTHVAAIVGLAGAGKSTVASLFHQDYGYEIVYFGGVVIDEVKRLGMSLDQSSEQVVREALRRKYGMAAMAVLSEERIRLLLNAGKNVVIDGLYSLDEFKLLTDQFCVYLLAVHASTETRGVRMSLRRTRPLSPSELLERDLAEIAALDKAAPIALAHWHIVNEEYVGSLADQVSAIVHRMDRTEADPIQGGSSGR